ncbi:bifunctional pyr operon transcriptional regulator/uracil phosphoribosyltransferase PyrR [Flaviflexus massiliensis]|uniref:bifunctional pyr operon transcriptional regulator/uracil phosphoribosyltransferase PyrR n=1 Tax=Flaviflexus massiliensis TaxID=1522309 RepID=UPI0006D550F2|nr:bifunctional pyr operon transcriptional regulator/uracil phosphoribosyltransferase PyrR [Flaviflexus massiliensis]
MSQRTVMDGGDISRSITRMAHEVLERNHGAESVILLGIPSRGVPIAQRLADAIKKASGEVVPVGALDVTMYRDDLRRNPTRAPSPTRIPEDGIDDKIVVLVDDVFFSGRTIRAALDALTNIGRPTAVQLAVLADRGHRELPIRADYVGKNLPTSRAERVFVQVEEVDETDAVIIEDPR